MPTLYNTSNDNEPEENLC